MQSNNYQTQNQKSSRKSSKSRITREWKKLYIPIISALGALLLLSIILICVLPAKQKEQISQTPPPAENFASGWKSHIVAPFVDLSSWVQLSNAYSLNGVPNMGKVEEDTGITYYNLGFIQPDTDTPLDKSGNIRWGWGGYYELSEKGNDGYQYPSIKKAISDLDKMNAKYTISIGGQLGDAPWIVTQNIDKLENFYMDVINTYNLKRLDLDIEESNQTESANIANAKAIKKVQDKTGIEIVLTIPIMPNGWHDKQIKIIKAYLNQGVDIALINSMTMCYGTGLYSGEDYGDASVRAIENSVKQMQDIFSSYGIYLSEQEAYAKTGATIDIGYESDLYPIFTLEMTKKVVNHAKEHGYGMISYWSINRDSKMTPNKAITIPFAYLDAMNEFYK